VIQEKYRGARKWSRNKQAVATVIWISFLAASVATMMFFALFDPTELMATLDGDIDIDRQSGYAIGFFFFWTVSAGCSAVTAWLVRTAPKRDQSSQ